MKAKKVFFVNILVILILSSCVTPQKNIQQTKSLDTSLNNLVNQIVLSLSQNKKTKIAIVEFSDIQGNVSNFGRYLAEELTTRLFLTGKFEVVERQLLNKVLQEHLLSNTGFIDENSAVKLGKILGVDAIASGSVTDLGTSVKVNARLISAESGKIFSVASQEITKDNKLKKLLNQGIVSQETEKKSEIKANKIIEKEGFKFEFIEARMSDRRIICQIKLTNTTENDKKFEVTYGWQYKTEIFDNAGNESFISAVKFGDQLQKIKGTSQYSGASKKIIAGTTVNMELHFDNVSSKAVKINLLQILCGYRGFNVEFRNFPIRKI